MGEEAGEAQRALNGVGLFPFVELHGRKRVLGVVAVQQIDRYRCNATYQIIHSCRSISPRTTLALYSITASVRTA